MSGTSPSGDAEEARLRLIWNERRKLEATFMNSLGIAVVVAGAITPLLAALYGLNNAPALSWLTNGWLVPMILIVGFGLNVLATNWLKGMK